MESFYRNSSSRNIYFYLFNIVIRENVYVFGNGACGR